MAPLKPLAIRAWIRRSEFGLLIVAIGVGLVAGAATMAIGEAVRVLHILLFGRGATLGLSILRNVSGWTLVVVPTVGGVLLAVITAGARRLALRQPIDPIEANALYGGRMSLRDAALVVVQNVISNGFGGSVGMEAGYTQAGAGLASSLGAWIGLRRADLRVVVGCGAAAAIAASFDAPLTGAFYGFELIIGNYAISALAPVMASAVTATLFMRFLHGSAAPVMTGGLVLFNGWGFAVAVLLGIVCGLLAIALMYGVTLSERVVRRAVPWVFIRPILGGLAVGSMALYSTASLSAGHGLFRQILVTEPGVAFLATVVLLKAAAVVVSIGSGFRGGLFFASLLLGACVGKLFTALLVPLGAQQLDALLFAIVGTSAFAAGVVGAPLAMTFLALETTDNFLIAGYVLVAVIAANTVVRQLFGYSFATWRLHIRGEVIRSAHDIGWLREMTVGSIMRKEVPTAPLSMSLSSFKERFPLGSNERVMLLNEAGGYAGLVILAEAYASESGSMASLLRFQDCALLATMNVKQAMEALDKAESEALPVIDGWKSRHLVGMLTASHLTRRYSEELEKRQRELLM